MTPRSFCPTEQATLTSCFSACLSEAAEAAPGHHKGPPLSLTIGLDPYPLCLMLFIFTFGLFTG